MLTKRLFQIASLATGFLLIAGCSSKPQEEAAMSIEKMPFGSTPDGNATLYVLTNANGMKVKITDYGGTVTEICVANEAIVEYGQVLFRVKPS
mgnify:CR=1 FL=1